jgi:hypothetical protein
MTLVIVYNFIPKRTVLKTFKKYEIPSYLSTPDMLVLKNLNFVKKCFLGQVSDKSSMIAEDMNSYAEFSAFSSLRLADQQD